MPNSHSEEQLPFTSLLLTCMKAHNSNQADKLNELRYNNATFEKISQQIKDSPIRHIGAE